MSKCSCTNISYLDSQTILAHFERVFTGNEKTEYCYSCCNTPLDYCVKIICS